jgi:hypothetical protein
VSRYRFAVIVPLPPEYHAHASAVEHVYTLELGMPIAWVKARADRIARHLLPHDKPIALYVEELPPL